MGVDAIVFGKFSKKKLEEPPSEIKSKQKNDLFTLLEESPKKNSDLRQGAIKH